MSKLAQFFTLPALRIISAALSLLAYTPSFLALPAFLSRLYRSIFKDGGFFPFAIFTVVSYGLITLALIAVAVRALSQNWHPKALNWTQVALVLYWLPHSLIVGFWCELVDTSAWID